MNPSPKKAPNRPLLDERSHNINSGLKTLAPQGTFGGITQPEYQAKCERVAALRLQLRDAEQIARNLRDDLAQSELDLWDVSGMVVRGVAGDPAYGPNSPLYGSFGLVRASQRRSGLTRKGDQSVANKAKVETTLLRPFKMLDGTPVLSAPENGSNGKH